MEVEKGNDVVVYVICKVKINSGIYYIFINFDVDIVLEKWNLLKYYDWILFLLEGFVEKLNR